MRQNDDDLLRRSFRITGHPTSLSMERIFWEEFRRIAKQDGRSMTDIISEIDAQRESGLSRTLRVYILKRVLSQ